MRKIQNEVRNYDETGIIEFINIFLSLIHGTLVIESVNPFSQECVMFIA